MSWREQQSWGGGGGPGAGGEGTAGKPPHWGRQMTTVAVLDKEGISGI